jgi:hypothetical protein
MRRKLRPVWVADTRGALSAAVPDGYGLTGGPRWNLRQGRRSARLMTGETADGPRGPSHRQDGCEGPSRDKGFAVRRQESGVWRRAARFHSHDGDKRCPASRRPMLRPEKRGDSVGFRQGVVVGGAPFGSTGMAGYRGAPRTGGGRLRFMNRRPCGAWDVRDSLSAGATAVVAVTRLRLCPMEASGTAPVGRLPARNVAQDRYARPMLP